MLAIAAAKLGWGPVRGYDHEALALEASTANAAANGVELELERVNLRERLPPLAPTVVANMTAPVLAAVARLVDPDDAPRTLVCSGLLPGELDATAAAFAPAGLIEAERRRDGDWAALLLRRLSRRKQGLVAGGEYVSPMLPFAMYLDTGYKIALFFHLVAVVVGFGPTFGYAIFFSVVPSYPKATPALLAGIQRADRYLVNPGMVILLIAGIVLMASGSASGTAATSSSSGASSRSSPSSASSTASSGLRCARRKSSPSAT